MVSTSRCDCCGLPVGGTSEYCPRCGYPVNEAKEEQFLETSLRALGRVVAYGGADMTVVQLVNRYRARLSYLAQVKQQPSRQIAQNAQEAPAASISVLKETMALPGTVPAPSIEQQPPAVPVQRPQPAPARSFSLGSFLEEQTITIVAALGAFLILIGALSFVATTTNLLFSFLVVFVVHALFGGVGMASYRYRSFRAVAVIYTAIFALLVPLVGFSAYRVVSGSMVQFSTPTLVAIAALYAALAYGMLAVYQKFSPFAYLAVVALAVATLALASALRLGYWWWPDVAMLLALPALLSVSRSAGDTRPFAEPWTILREPLRVFMGACVIACLVGILAVYAYSLLLDTTGHALTEVRLSLSCMTLLLLCWNCLLVGRTTRRTWALPLPYLFLLCLLACAYTLAFDRTGYVLALTGVALLYYGLTRFVPRVIQTFHVVKLHVEWLALSLVAVVPFIVAAPFLLAERAYSSGFQRLPVSWETIAGLLAILVGLVLTIGVIIGHTGWHPQAPQANWRWLILLSGFLLNAAYSLFILLLNAEPVWWLLGLSLVLVGAAVVTRRLSSAVWALPLDVLALAEIVLMLLLGFNQSSWLVLALWLFVAALVYVVALYQRRAYVLVLPVVFAALIVPVFLTYPRILLGASMLLPLVAAGIHRLITKRRNSPRANTTPVPGVVWEWPLLAIGVFYGAMIGLHDTLSTFSQTGSTLENWFHITFPVGLELASIALFWYGAAALVRVRRWLLIVTGFAVAAVLVPGSSFQILLWLASLLALLGLGVSRLAGKVWASPLYTVAVFAAVMMGVNGYNQGQLAAATGLLIFAVLVYLIAAVERSLAGLWSGVGFAIWSLCYAEQVGDLYRLFAVALVGAALGIGIGCLRFLVPKLAGGKSKLLGYALPLYTVACIAAVLTGIYGMLVGMNAPFFVPIPTALLVYALVAYGVVLFERAPEMQFIPLALAAWAIAQVQWPLWLHIIAYSLLCILIFAAQSLRLMSSKRVFSPARLYRGLSIAGQMLVVLASIAHGALVAQEGPLAHVGAGALLVLAGLVFAYGLVDADKAVRRACNYGAGLFCALVFSWELSALGLNHFDWLTLPPAVYLVVVGPFLTRDSTLPRHRRWGQLCSFAGAVLLLLPILWISFSEGNLAPTLILAGEALGLLLLGIITRVRIFVLSGAALTVVGAMHALFLPSLGIPTSLALTILGITLLALASGLSLARRRLRSAWTGWE